MKWEVGCTLVPYVILIAFFVWQALQCPPNSALTELWRLPPWGCVPVLR